MCRSLIVYATLDDGKTLLPEWPEPIEFSDPEGGDFTPEKPTCTCWIGQEEGKGKILRQTFVEECLQPFLEKVLWGNIVIEIR